MVEMTMTPYQYTYQNPIRYTDPTGMMPGDPDEIKEGNKGSSSNPNDIEEITVVGKRNPDKVGIRHSYWNGYTSNQGSSSNRLQSSIRGNSATASIDRTVNETLSFIPGAEGAEIGNALASYEEGDYWGAGFSTFAAIPIIGKFTKLGKLGKLFKFARPSIRLGAGVMANLGESLGEFAVPKCYTYVVKGGKSVFVSPHAMKHLEELAAHGAGNPNYLRLLGQTHLQSINSALDDILSQGAIQYNKMYISGGNEIMFGAPRALDELPAVIHFQPKY